MTKKVNSAGHLFRHFIAATILLASPSLVQASCVVGGTDFTTKTALCNPTFTEDTIEGGWYYKDHGTELVKKCKESLSDVAGNAVRKGLTSGVILSGCSDDFTDYEEATSGNVSDAEIGYGKVVGNARVASPYFMDTESGNIFIQGGTGKKNALLTYSLSGLKPGSTVTLTCDVYNLWSIENLETALTLINTNATKLQASLDLFGGYKFSMQTQGTSKLSPGTGRIDGGNPPNIFVCSGGINKNSAQPDGDIAQYEFKSWGEKTTLTLKTTVDETGSVVFTFGRNGGREFAPIGIDNIEITGDIMPEIASQKTLPVCPANPVLLYLKQSFPDDATYSWSGLGVTSTGKTMVVTPEEANKTYPVTCKVTMGTCSATASIDVTTKTCCSMKNDAGKDVPVAETYVVYEDFGEFSSDLSSYSHTDEEGNTTTIPVQGGMYTDVTRPYVTYTADGVTTGIPAATGSGSSPNDVWMITNVNPYTPGVTGDASGTGLGGMLIFDLSGGTCGGKSIKDMVIYQREIKGLCKGKEISFSALFGAINNNPAGVGEMKIVLREGSATGNILYEKESGVLYGTEGWQEAAYKFTLDHDVTSVVLQVVNVGESYNTSAGDMAVDNIMFSVCTPPDVAVESSLTAEELLDLCTDNDLVLKAQISETAKSYYSNKEGYLFQYTYQDPSTTDADKIEWHDMGSGVQTTGEFSIPSPADDEAFAPLKDASKGVLNVYFRVVIGEKDYLVNNRKEWEGLSALSPCRAISISSIPIVAALNCAKCYKPDKVEISSASATTNKATKELTLCAGDKLNLSAAVTAKNDDGEAYSGYYLFWKKDGEDIADMKKLPVYSTDADGKAVEPAEDLVVENDGSYTTETKVVYSVIAVDTFEFSSVAAATCKDSDKVTVTFLPTPKVKTINYTYCEGKPTTDVEMPTASVAGNTVSVYSDDELTTTLTGDIPFATLTAATPGPKYTYYYTETSAGGCVSDSAHINITVNAIPDYTVADIPDFCAGQSEVEALETADAEDKYEIAWTAVTAGGKADALNSMAGSATPYNFTYVVTDAVTGCAAESQEYFVKVNPACTIELTVDSTECGKTTVSVVTNPTTASVSYSDGTADIEGKETFEFPTSYKNYIATATADDYCPASDTVSISVKAIPGDVTAADVSCYLKSQAASFKDVQTMCTSPAASYDATAANNAGAALVWRVAGTTTWSSTVPTPTVKNANDPSEEKIDYEVALQNTRTECIGTVSKFTAHIYGAPVPNVTNAEYCLGATAAALDERVKINNTIAGTYNLAVYSDKAKTTPVDLTTVPSTATAGVVTYYATQTGVGGESDPVAFTITTYGVDKPTVTKTDYTVCTGDVVSLSAQTNANAATYMMSTGLLWKGDNGWSESVPTVSTETTGSTTYSVQQYYNIATVGFEDKCKSEIVDITVNVEETTPPTGLKTVTYLYSELETQGSFSDILTEDSKCIDIVAGYDYYYAPCDASGTLLTGAMYSTEVPHPDGVDKSELDGGAKHVYYSVYRQSKTGAKCASTPVIVDVTIADSPMPYPVKLFYCEDESLPATLDGIVTMDVTKKAAENYNLLWYGTTQPTSATMETAGSPTPTVPSIGDAVDDGSKKTIVYYVAQQDKDTKAIGTPSTVTITIYPKPVQTITTPATVCETAVDLSKSVAFDKVVTDATYSTNYFSDAAGASAIASSVTESGTCYAQTSFPVPYATNTGAVCASTVDPVVVTIDTINLEKVTDVGTCPNTEAVITANVTTNAASASFAWSSQSTTIGDAQTDPQSVDASGKATSEFTTKALPGNAGDTYKYNLTVTAGTCTASQNGIVVTLGDGPVVGTLTLTEADNTETGKIYTNSRDVTSDPFYMCGQGVNADASFTTTDNSTYTWTNAAGSTVDPTSLGVGVYTVSFINKCATSVKFEIKDASINNNQLKIDGNGESVNDDSTDPLTVCENTPVTFTLKYLTNSDQPTNVAWTKDEVATTSLTKTGGSLSAAKPDDTGKYTYTITNRGCTATGSASLKVKPYIKFTPEKEEYVARRDSALNIATEITVPAAGTPSSIDWTDATGTSVNSTKDYVYTVSKDNEFTISMSDDDYCDASATVSVKMDGRLQLETSIDESMCRGDKGVYLTIDTTGTGKLIYSNKASITVMETIGEASHYVSGWRLDEGKLLLEVSPTADATYTTTFIYREDEGVDEQKVTSTASITVLQPIQIKVPTGLGTCAGEELDINLVSVTPEGAVTVTWDADATITSGNTGESITVKPEYDETSARNHKSTKIYYLTATMEGCKDKTDKVTITVDEPITGEMSDTTICQGFGVRLDASNYQASTYSWTTPLVGNEVGNSQTTYVKPDVTSVYTIAMTRGNCKATDSVTVNVNSKPSIVSIDSVDYRSVNIVLDESFGTSPFQYTVDSKPFTQSSQIDSLAYNKHVAYVKDVVGCMDTLEFSIVAPPIKIPIWFSPNGDGDYDNWKVPSLNVTYPEAEISIFDRWGKKLVTFTGADEGWDGTYNGNPMPSTDYWYEIHIREIDQTYTGHFTLMRR